MPPFPSPLLPVVLLALSAGSAAAQSRPAPPASVPQPTPGSTMATAGAPSPEGNGPWTQVQKMVAKLEDTPVIVISGVRGKIGHSVQFNFKGSAIESIMYRTTGTSGQMFACVQKTDFPCDLSKVRLDLATGTGSVDGLPLTGAAYAGTVTVTLTGVIR
jgi:hypothetical protein